ncbi:MAG TPA: hypothetical protein VFJ43_18420 [Bacteroidia bacterium]|nr:hypothetical protein [Bacteroidia bacterium]
MMVDISSSGLFSYPSASYIVSAPKRNVHSDKELLIMISKGRYVTPDEKKRALLYSQKLRIKKLKK